MAKEFGVQAMSSIGALPAEDTERMFREVASLVKRHGYPPTDRRTAASHEAGHVVVGLAMGGTFDTSVVRVDDYGRYVGYSRVVLPGAPWPTLTLENCAQLLPGLLAGIEAERLTGRFHPASSIEEVYLALMHARLVVGQGAANEMVIHAQSVAYACLMECRPQFDAIATSLERHGRLTRPEARQIGKRIPPVDKSDWLGCWHRRTA